MKVYVVIIGTEEPDWEEPITDIFGIYTNWEAASEAQKYLLPELEKYDWVIIEPWETSDTFDPLG